MVKQISVFLENQAGRLASVVQILGQSGVNICALSISDTTKFGILRLVVSQPEMVEPILRENGFTVSLTDVIAVGMEHEPGRLSEVLSILNKNGIGVEYIYAYAGKYREEAVVILKTEESERATDVLRQNGMNVLSEQELCGV